MANTDTKESGIYAWMVSVRDSMANDPCRRIFEDQVQSHAFTFLDDYLESILAGPQQGPIIELVKTPARRRNMPRRTRAATAAKSTTLLSLDSVNSTKEVPINSFHKALLQAREISAQDAPNPQKPSVRLPSVSNGSQETTHGRSMSVQLAGFPEATVGSRTEAISSPQYHGDPQSKSSIPRPASERSTELSVIAEGDESPERGAAPPSRLSTVDSNQGESPHVIPLFSRATEEYPILDRNPKAIETDDQSQIGLSPHTPSSQHSVDFYHSVPLDLPQEVQSFKAGNHTEPLPSRTATNSPKNHGRNAFTGPLPVVPASNLAQIPDTIYVPLNDSSPRSLAHKNGTTGFPTLPAPSPLRKSLRVAQDALTGSALPTTAPAPAPLGKRTSWLMKAREAKAMEGTNLLPVNSAVPIPIAFPRASTAIKRKSGDMVSELPPGLDWDKDQRKLKVAKSTEVGVIPPKEMENDNQYHFACVQGEPIIRSFVAATIPVDHLESHRMEVDQEITRPDFADEKFIDLFKRTVEDLGARAGKSMGMSLGGAAAAALAEARAAAEAKVAERNKVSDSGEHHDDDRLDQEPLESGEQSDEQAPFVPLPQTAGGRRLSVSDLAPETIRCKEPEISVRMAQAMDATTITNSGNQSMSATPPASPPSKGNSGFVKPMGPVFNKPPPQPVFMPPASKQHTTTVSTQPKEFPFNLPPSKFTLPAIVSLGIPARLTSTSDDPPLVQQRLQTSVQPSQPSALSDPIFDRREGASTPSTLCIKSRPSEELSTVGVVDDDDDSWPLEEKLAAVEPGWRPFDFSNVDKEDTWSSLPTESQGTTRNLTTERTRSDTVALPMETDTEAVPNNGRLEREQQTVETSDVECSAMETSETEEAAEAGTGNRSRAESTVRVRSQASLSSAASSSQSQVGFFSQATKLVNSMLGGGKKAKPELKSLQLAAAAAKKQQEEADKKIQRLKDMETRRQGVMAKKAEEERTRLHEEEKRVEIEKRKRDREENTDRRPLKPPVSTKKAEDDASKKRKLAPETDKKSESKKFPSKDKKELAPPAKSSATPATKLVVQKGTKATATALVSSATYNSTQNTTAASSANVIPEAKPFKVVPSALKSKAKAKQEEDMGDKLPSTMIQSQMAARAKAQMQAAKLPTPEVLSESIELPEINSEYSDSEDEDRVRTFDPPDWAQSPELHTALQMQSTVNPDDIFGAIRPLRMDEMFRTRQSRFRARTSSANWSGTDRLTVEEIREYERRMGFQQNCASRT